MMTRRAIIFLRNIYYSTIYKRIIVTIGTSTQHSFILELERLNLRRHISVLLNLAIYSFYHILKIYPNYMPRLLLSGG